MVQKRVFLHAWWRWLIHLHLFNIYLVQCLKRFFNDISRDGLESEEFPSFVNPVFYLIHASPLDARMGLIGIHPFSSPWFPLIPPGLSVLVLPISPGGHPDFSHERGKEGSVGTFALDGHTHLLVDHHLMQFHLGLLRNGVFFHPSTSYTYVLSNYCTTPSIFN